MVSCCGLASGGIWFIAGMIIPHTHLHIYFTQSALYSHPSEPVLSSHSVAWVHQAAGLLKWKWPVITKVMTAAVGRHQTLAYLWHCVSGVLLHAITFLHFFLSSVIISLSVSLQDCFYTSCEVYNPYIVMRIVYNSCTCLPHWL